MPLTDDESRLLALYRALRSGSARSDLLNEAACILWGRYLANQSVYDFMPEAAGAHPTGHIHDPSSLAHIIFCGAEEMGDPSAVLLGSSDFDEEEAIPRFAEGATQAALDQGSMFNYDEAFAREYLAAWRWEVLQELVRRANEEA